MLKRSLTCEVCSAKVSELRRGRCWGCYSEWSKNRPVGMGALCCMCGDRRRELLKSTELLGAWVAICHNCSALVSNLRSMPQSIGEIRAALRRDRRDADRRWGKKDSRVFRYNRRGGDRRVFREDGSASIDDDMIIEISELVSDLDKMAEDEGPELTSIQDRPDLSDLPEFASLARLTAGARAGTADEESKEL